MSAVDPFNGARANVFINYCARAFFRTRINQSRRIDARESVIVED